MASATPTRVSGCTDPTGLQLRRATPTTDTDNTLCTFVDGVCDTCEAGADRRQRLRTTMASAMPTKSAGCTDPAACNYGGTPSTDSDNTPVHLRRRRMRHLRRWATGRGQRLPTTMASAMPTRSPVVPIHGLQLRRHTHHRHRQHALHLRRWRMRHLCSEGLVVDNDCGQRWRL